MLRLRLTLVDGHRVNPTVWTPESKWCQRHPAWPGGNFSTSQFGLTQKTVLLVPPGSCYHTPRYPTNASSATTTHPASISHYKANSSCYLCRFPKYFFSEAHRLLSLASYSSTPSLVSDKPFLLNFTITDAAPDTPRQPIADAMRTFTSSRGPRTSQSKRQNWHTALESFLKEYQTYPVDGNFEINSSLLSALSCYWPRVRLTLNAKTAINRFRISLRRVYYNDRLQGSSDENAQCILGQTSLNSWLLPLTQTSLLHQTNSLCHFGQRVGALVIEGVLDKWCSKHR